MYYYSRSTPFNDTLSLIKSHWKPTIYLESLIFDECYWSFEGCISIRSVSHFTADADRAWKLNKCKLFMTMLIIGDSSDERTSAPEPL